MQFVSARVESTAIKRRTIVGGEIHNATKMKFIYIHTLCIVQEIIAVYKTFFLNTLCTSNTFIKTALHKIRDTGLTTPALHGKHKPVNKISNAILEIM